MNVAVIGAGPAGMTTAYQLAKHGFKVRVFEASSYVGGMSRSLELWGQTVDLGPHRFFTKSPRIRNLWSELVGKDYGIVDRQTRIYYRGRFFDYPLKPLSALRSLGSIEATMCVCAYVSAQMRQSLGMMPDDATFESWVINRFGHRLYEIFFKSYSEKLWGLSCQDLSADFAAQRIKHLTLYEAIKNALIKTNTKHHTLVDRFLYPTQGTGMVYQRMAQRVRDMGGEIHLNCPIRRIIQNGETIIGIETDDNTCLTFDHVVSTMPLTLLVKQMKQVPGAVSRSADSLTFRNTILVYLHVDADDLFSDQWIYVHAPELRVGRITNFRNWVPQITNGSNKTILTLEYWCDDDDALWSQTDDNLIALARREMEATGLLRSAPVRDGHVHRIHRCYPVYQRGYQSHVERIADYLNTIENLVVIGRAGAFKYNNQDHSILMGMLAAENITTRRQHNLWQINTDYDCYQESGKADEDN